MSYWRYWGKASPGEHDQPCHLLPFHCLDVAAVGWQLLAPERALTRHMAQRLDMSSAELRHPGEGLRRPTP